jgi:hypothetical protein
VRRDVKSVVGIVSHIIDVRLSHLEQFSLDVAEAGLNQDPSGAARGSQAATRSSSWG